ncbi:Sds3-like-domain-containing protein [Amylocarpus encephaloides]|uniref:Sds3-like-domain-containing protein n=1 Tax=Amylocarpus encephaloides TaxID=45428 RepID=A0A9P8C264_9HELO|nr:Sds3-like-domain-containing protein [Amylocarpus encephaloides]
MAMSPSPQLSPLVGASQRIERPQSNSPPAQQLSKRDKKRTLLAERLAEITMQFSANRDVHYREQLQALQIDMNLIMEANAHGKETLPNAPSEIDELIQDNIKNTMMKSIGPNAPPRAGKMYADFAKEVSDAMEERDAALVTHRRDFEVKLSELEAAHAYRKRLAASEHKSLSTTLRDRLINSVTNKKNRLSRDKETMEIGESNALLLHPSQFGIANPASPGGIHGKRATRHRRDQEDLSALGESNKRKRKALDSDESPAPTRQRMDNGNNTPIWFAEKHALTATQIDSSLYSIDKLFTEKELSMAYNVAAIAAHNHMQRHPPFSEETDSPPNGKSDSSSDHEKAATGENENDEGDSALGGAMMERQYSHATRSTRGLAGNYTTGIGIDAFNDVSFPGNLQALARQTPKLPSLLAIQKTIGKSDAANQPASLISEDAAAELDMIRRARSYNDKEGYGRNLDLDNGGRSLLEAVATPRLYQFYVKSDDKQRYLHTSHEREDDEHRMGGELMEKSHSQAGSEIGGVAMSRQATGEGQSSRGRRIRHKEL